MSGKKPDQPKNQTPTRMIILVDRTPIDENERWISISQFTQTILFETTDPQTVSLVTSIYEKETEIKRLQSIIQGYKDATEKVIAG